MEWAVAVWAVRLRLVGEDGVLLSVPAQGWVGALRGDPSTISR
jgi:hypothetical protein